VKTTEYFKTSVMSRRPYLKEEWIMQVIARPVRKEVQENGRIRHWLSSLNLANIFELLPRRTENSS